MAALPATIDLHALTAPAGFAIPGPSATGSLGMTVAGLGDVNGDGIDDFLVIARILKSAYVVFGTAAGVASPFALTGLNGSNGYRVDAEVRFIARAGVTDFNGDGLGDLVLTETGSGPNDTVATVIYGRSAVGPAVVSPGALTAAESLRITLVSNEDLNADLAVGVGDFNGDGYGDVLIGDENALSPHTAPLFLGSAYMVFGRPGAPRNFDLSSLDGSNGFAIPGLGPNAFIGTNVGALGDINGDGLADVSITAGRADPPGRADGGIVYVMLGSRAAKGASFNYSTLDGTNGFRILGPEAGFLPGLVTGIGDINGDGFGDLAIGAHLSDPLGRQNAGSLYVLYGKAGGFAATIDLATLGAADGFRIIGDGAEDRLGVSFNAAGDVNGDGVDDFLVSAPGFANAGESYLFYGRTAGFAATIDIKDFDASLGVRFLVPTNSNFGPEVAAGDFNNDGLSDLLFGEQNAAPGGLAGAGEAWVVYGQAGGASTTGADNFTGAAGVDHYNGLAGADTMRGLGGGDVLNGGPGADISAYADTAAQYEWWSRPDGTWRVKDLRAGSPEGTDVLTDVESLQFSDKTVKILGLTTAEKLTDAYSNILRATATGSELTFLNNLIGAVNGSTKTLGAAIGEIVAKADQTTAVAAMSYQFFLNFVPSKGGFDYLVSPQGPNPNNINSAYYQSFNIENRYINFAVNLGKVGEGAPSFLAEYGSKTLFQATKDAYMEIFGGTVVDSKINTILDSSVGSMSRAQYFALYGGDGLTGIGTKAAMVGWLLTEAAKADLGMYANSSNAFLTDLADGAQTLVDVVGAYGKAEYVFNG